MPAASAARATGYVAEPATFDGIVRADGRVATRNYIGILTSVNCSATVARAIADHFRRDTNPRALERFANVDGVVALTHGAGCATDSAGEPLQVLRRTLGGYARHANFASVMVVGLGCETNQISGLMEQEGLAGGPALHTFNIQETGGTKKTVAHGIELVEWLLDEANRVTRQPVPAGRIMVGLQCGGSDGYSGISANPSLGAAVDRLVRHRGTAILSETPEIYGGEHLLTRRAVSQEVADKLIARIRWWERYCERNDAAMDNNPSAGNKAGGLTTILEKSLGAIAKSGTTNLVDVVEYAEPVTANGLVFMDTPGLRPGVGDRPGRRRRQPDLLHHRPRLGLRLRAGAFAQALDQHGALAAAGRRHRHQLRRRRRRHRLDRRDGRADLPPDARHRVRPEDEERAARLRPERVRSLVARRRDVSRARLSTNAQASSIQTGAWSLALSRPRTCLSTPAATRRGRRLSLSSRWSMRRPASRGQLLRR
jgi:altronate dehydratase